MLSLIADQIRNRFFLDWSFYFKMKKPAQINHMIMVKCKRYLIFFFADQAAVPFAVSKATSIEGFFQSMNREYERIQHFRKNMPEFFRKRVPELLFRLDSEDESALVMAHVPGKTIDAHLTMKKLNGSIPENMNMMEKVTRCWEEFMSGSDSQKPFTDQFIKEYVSKVEDSFFSYYKDEARMEFEFQEIKNKALELCSSSAWSGAVHGDFWKENLLFDEERQDFFLIDWEKSRQYGFPLFDMFLFCLTYLPEDHFLRSCLAPDVEIDGISRQLRNMLRHSVAKLSIDRVHAGIMLELFLFEMCVQGPIYYGGIFDADYAWKKRLDFFLANKSSILNNCFH